MVRRGIVGAAIAACAAAGCFIVTGGTDGYQLTDAGGLSASGCTGTSDCIEGQICCAVLPAPVCQTGPCALAQLCNTTKECGDSAPGCALQSCQIDGSTYTLQACGALSLCSFK